ncbi:c-type cytochrome [Aquitalea sp.]|uniref:c-type cytochrome n=1 Tax=Aquitalea sp. TaxID=1872623 RepID=UPI00258E323F|nr:c-type cytochrome [Aquitalea sp.]
MKITRIALLGMLILTPLHVAAAGAAEDLARQWCANCHAADGNSSSPLFPRLAGQQAGYIVQQLQALKNHSRSDESAHDYMWGVAATLDDNTIASIAEYFAGQKPLPNPATVAASLVDQGGMLFRNGNEAKGTPPCMACHGPNGEGSESGPRLAGQHAAYVDKQLHVFASTQRPSAVEMQAIVRTLDDKEIRALAAYIQALH